jgi:hypothetical protein
MADNKSGRVVHEDEEEEEKQKEEEENAVALLESQRDVCELATTVTVLLLFPLGTADPYHKMYIIYSS